MYGYFVVVLNIMNTLILGVGVLVILHVQDVHDDLVDGLGLAIGLGVESSGICELGVQ
jgi:hypothetical protein